MHFFSFRGDVISFAGHNSTVPYVIPDNYYRSLRNCSLEKKYTLGVQSSLTALLRLHDHVHHLQPVEYDIHLAPTVIMLLYVLCSQKALNVSLSHYGSSSLATGVPLDLQEGVT